MQMTKRHAVPPVPSTGKDASRTIGRVGSQRDCGRWAFSTLAAGVALVGVVTGSGTFTEAFPLAAQGAVSTWRYVQWSSRLGPGVSIARLQWREGRLAVTLEQENFRRNDRTY